jgi:hypothetical protein
MKAALYFRMPEEREEFYNAHNGVRYRIALTDLDNWLRAKIKYEDLPQEKHDLYQEVRDKLYELLEGLEL